ncbi:MAG: OmpP1/FadL family transporter [Endozoicomonas sp.]
MHSSQKGSRQRRLFLISSLALAVTVGNAAAGGFEKATMWDAEYSALAGAAVSSVDNSSAIFFNPAGLAFAEANDIALHASPTWTQANGPAAGNDTYIKGEKNFVPNGGFTGAYRLNDRLVLGYGVYGAGGASAKYKNVRVGNQGGGLIPDTSVVGDYSTDIKIMEAGLGLGYRINNNWSIGGTYRLTYATADINMMSTVDRLGAIGAAVGYNDMSGWNNFGVRLGTMYRSDDNRWGWGLNYRSEVDVKAKGNASFRNGLGIGNYDKRDATARTGLPMQISSGIHYAVFTDLTLFGEVTYSNYSANDKIKFESDESVAVGQINTNWEDQYNYRIAAEYTGIEGWALRAGYIYTTAVVPEEYAAPTFSTPAAAHTYTFGAGTSLIDGKVDLDMAAEYNRAKNTDVKGGDKLTDTSRAYSGRYDSKAWAVHATLRYKF